MTDAVVVTRLLTSHHHTARFIGRGTPYWLEGGPLLSLSPRATWSQTETQDSGVPS